MASRTVRVTSAQKQAAQALVVRSTRSGRPVSAAVTKIANAQVRVDVDRGVQPAS